MTPEEKRARLEREVNCLHVVAFVMVVIGAVALLVAALIGLNGCRAWVCEGQPSRFGDACDSRMQADDDVR